MTPPRPRDRLPTEVPTPATPGRVALVVLVTLLGVLALNFVAGLALERWTTNRGYWLVREKWRQPKKPRYAESGEGCGALSTRWRRVSISLPLACA